MITTTMPVSCQRRRGFTLTEIAIVLGIIGIILGAIWAAAAMVYENNRTKEAREQTLAIVNNWRSVYGSRPLDLGSNTDITSLTANNSFEPSTMLPPSGTSGGCASSGNSSTCFLEGPWTGSTVSVISMQNENALRVQYNNLTQTACNHMGNAIANAAGLILTMIDGTQQTYPPLGTSNTLNASQVSAQCSQAGNSNTVAADFSTN